MRQFKVVLSPEAIVQIVQAVAWCREHYGAQRALALEKAIDTARRHLVRLPEMGAPVRIRRRWRMDLRRVGFTRWPYHLYYRLDLEACEVEILLLWHVSRRPPKL